MNTADIAATRAIRRRAVPTIAGALGAALMAGLLGACGEAPRLDACAWMRDPVETAGRTVVLVDGSTSVSGPAGARDYAHSIGALLTSVVERKDTVSVGSFSGDSAQITWIAKDRSADWVKDNHNEINQKKRKQQAVSCLTDLVDKAGRAVPRSGGSNVLAALTAGTSSLEGAAGRRSLLVLTDGLSTTGCADLRAAAFRDKSEIKAITRVCAARDETPSLTGVHLTLAGLGQPATGQPAPTAAQRTWLSNLWRGLCGAGKTAAPDTSCTLAPTAIGTAERSKPRKKPPQDPAVHYAQDRPETYELPGAALFDANSSAVRPQALPLLNDVAVSARTTPGSRVTVLGYVDPRGRPDNNHQLSQARADAVKDVLTGLGVQRVTAHGRGLPTGCAKPEHTAGGRMTAEDKLQCDRRVDIEITRK
ncbi:OmpA family protein [Streptomyces sp. ID38640]|uniref:OmpA family protein n=1 Tax=Streptomyces sp. ID38640 TaxID=1265399 RepID=UPI00140EA232|nr:OmpA family protein [Streptomyces sp. ID38640]QIK10675.1 OmpA family protein [Streptomyces sp. ID38640]